MVQDRRHRYPLASAAWDKGIAPAVPEVLLVDGIRWGSVGPLLFISLAIMGSPGPATISLMAAGSAYGVPRSPSEPIGINVCTTIRPLAGTSGDSALPPFLASLPPKPTLFAASATSKTSRDNTC